MFSYVRFFLENVKMEKKKTHWHYRWTVFPFFLNIYLFLFNAQLVSTVEFKEICHLQCEAELPE